jgi:hypothetical protein
VIPQMSSVHVFTIMLESATHSMREREFMICRTVAEGVEEPAFSERLLE